MEEEMRLVSGPYTPNSPAAIRVETDLVPVVAVVRDSSGKPVAGLTKDDFQIFDSGKQQVISAFNMELNSKQEPEHPAGNGQTPLGSSSSFARDERRYIAFYFDDRNLSAPDLIHVRNAAKRFVSAEMLQGDRIAIVTSSGIVSAAFTDERNKLLALIDQISSHVRAGPSTCPHIEPYQAWQIDTYGDDNDAFQLALNEAVQCNCANPRNAACRRGQIKLVEMQARLTADAADSGALDALDALSEIVRYTGKMQGTKIVLMASSGFFSMSNKIQQQQDEIIDSALRSGVRINTLDAKGLAAEWLGNSPSNDGRAGVLSGSQSATQGLIRSQQREGSNDRLGIVAEATGGRFIHNTNDIEGGVRMLAAAPEVSYSLGFIPQEVKTDGAYHPLKVRLANRNNCTVEFRPGYFSPSADSRTVASRVDALKSEVLGSAASSDLTVRVEAKKMKLITGEPGLSVSIHVDVRSLPFKKRDGRHTERLIFITALFDRSNRFVEGAQGVVEMALKDATLAELSASGGSASVVLQAPPGTYRLRQVTQELNSDRISASDGLVVIE